MFSMQNRVAALLQEPETKPPAATKATAESIVHEALDSLQGATKPEAASLVTVLTERGIDCAWQLLALRDAELAELVIDRAGWKLGELLALRVALARVAAKPPQAASPLRSSVDNASQPTPLLDQLLTLPASASKPDLRAFSKGGRTAGLLGDFVAILAMPASRARASLLLLAEHTSQTSAVLAFVLWQFRVAGERAASYGALSQITNFVITLGVLLLMFALVMCSSLMFFLGITFWVNSGTVQNIMIKSFR